MEYLLGLLSGVVLFVVVGGAYYMGTRKSTARKKEPDSAEKQRIERIKKEFDQVMNYTYEQAMGGDKS